MPLSYVRMNESSTREALLEAARACVRRDGLAGTTSRRITEAAGANLAAITYHFGSKDDLLAEALFGELERRLQPALTLLAGDGPPELRLAQVVATLTDEFERSRRDTLVYFEALLLAVRDQRYRRSALELYRALRVRLAQTIAGLAQGGPVPDWVDPEAMAGLILAVANGIALQSQLDPQGPDHRAVSTEFAQLLLAAGSGSSP
jgi:AcrR family transcriptional regulator